MKRVCVTGERGFRDRDAVERELTEIAVGSTWRLELLLLDDEGVASFAARWALRYQVKAMTYAANRGRGHDGGAARNALVLDSGLPDLILTFGHPRGHETNDLIRRANRRGIDVRVVL